MYFVGGGYREGERRWMVERGKGKGEEGDFAFSRLSEWRALASLDKQPIDTLQIGATPPNWRVSVKPPRLS